MRNRGELTVLFHPLSSHEVCVLLDSKRCIAVSVQIEDHTARAMWLGPSYRLDLTVLEEDLGHIPFQC